MAHWAKDPTLVQGMFYAFVFQDVLRFEICCEDVRANLVEAIEDCKWAEFEAWLDAYHDLFIHHPRAEAPNLCVGSVHSLVQREPLFGGRNDGNTATLTASLPKSDPNEKK